MGAEFGGDCRDVNLTGVTRVFSTGYAFIAVKDGPTETSMTCWGDAQSCAGHPMNLRQVHGTAAEPDCAFDFVRIPRTGSTALHNAIVDRGALRARVCSQSSHERFSFRQRPVILALRDPLARFASAFRYSYEDIGQPGVPASLFLARDFPTLDAFVAAIALNPNRLRQYGVVFRMQTEFLPLRALHHHLRVLCVADGTDPLHLQLAAILGERVEEIEQENGSRDIPGRPPGYDSLSNSSKRLLRWLLKDDFSLFERGCGRLLVEN